MGKLKGILPIEGTVGNITFSKTADGIIVREKGGIPAERIANDPAFARTRENNQEFGRAGKAARLVRNAFREVVLGGADKRLIARLVQVTMSAIRQDVTNVRGQRNMTDGATTLLEGFDFNNNGRLSTSFYAPLQLSIDRNNGSFTVSINPFIPASMVAAPSGATHFRIAAAGAIVDFANQYSETDSQFSNILPWDAQSTQTITLNCSVSGGSTAPLMLAVGVEFYQEVNGQQYPLKNGAYNAIAIVRIDV